MTEQEFQQAKFHARIKNFCLFWVNAIAAAIVVYALIYVTLSL